MKPGKPAQAMFAQGDNMQKNWKRPFIIIYTGQAFSIIGSAVVQFAVIWWLTLNTRSAVVLAVSTLVAFLPNIFLGPFAGVLVDRFNRRTVMIAADGLVALSSAVLALFFALSAAPPIWVIYVVLFIRGVGNTFHSPAMQAAIPMLVPPELLTKAGGWGNLIASGSSMIGPILGAALMGLASMPVIMLVDIAGAVIAIFCLMFVRIPDVPRTDEKLRFLGDLKQGLRAIRENKPLAGIFVPMLLVNILFMPLGSLYPLLILTHFNGTAWHNSIAEFVFAAGLLLSSLLLGVWGGSKKRFGMVSIAVAVMGLTAALCGVLPSDGFVFFLVLVFVMGAAGTFANVPLMAYTQETVAADVLGKVLSFLLMATSLAMPIGLLLAGPVSEVIGAQRWYGYSGLVLVAVAGWTWLRTRQYDKAPQMARTEQAEPTDEQP